MNIKKKLAAIVKQYSGNMLKFVVVSDIEDNAGFRWYTDKQTLWIDDVVWPKRGSRVIKTNEGWIHFAATLFEYLTDDELMGVLYHELGHFLYGDDEIIADAYGIVCGYGRPMRSALNKMFEISYGAPHNREWRAIHFEYKATPQERLARLDKMNYVWELCDGDKMLFMQWIMLKIEKMHWLVPDWGF